MSSPVIRRVTPDDASALAELGAATFIEAFGLLLTAQGLRVAVLAVDQMLARFFLELPRKVLLPLHLRRL